MRPMLRMMAKKPCKSLIVTGFHLANLERGVNFPSASSFRIRSAAYLIKIFLLHYILITYISVLSLCYSHAHAYEHGILCTIYLFVSSMIRPRKSWSKK